MGACRSVADTAASRPFPVACRIPASFRIGAIGWRPPPAPPLRRAQSLSERRRAHPPTSAGSGGAPVGFLEGLRNENNAVASRVRPAHVENLNFLAAEIERHAVPKGLI